jgi:hypothetical protein
VSGGNPFYWGVGDPSKSLPEQTGSWLYSLLPFIEQQSVFDNRSWWTPIEIYYCPMRRPARATPVADSDQFAAYGHGGWTWARSDYAGNEYVFPGSQVNPKINQKFTSIKDGMSHTILVGEKAFDPSVQDVANWFWDEPFFLGGSASTRRHGVEIWRDGVGIDFKHNWGSPHPAGAQFVFGDGAVHMISYDIHWKEFAKLLTPDFGEVPQQPLN